MSKLSKLRDFLKSRIFISLLTLIISYICIFHLSKLLPIITPFFFTIDFIFGYYYILLAVFILDIFIFIFSGIVFFKENLFEFTFKFGLAIFATIFFSLLTILPEILPIGSRFECSGGGCIHPMFWFLLIPINLSLFLPFIFLIEAFSKIKNLL